MFCSSLRRRNSFASAISALNAPPLGLRESQLRTHDLEIRFGVGNESKLSNKSSARQLRVLLISPRGVCETGLAGTIQRVRHFVALTGGQDLLIMFLLNPELTTGFMSAKDMVTAGSKSYSSVDGIYAFSQLQAEMVNHLDIPHVPMIPLCKVDSISETIHKHVSTLPRRVQATKSVSMPLELLQQCTANQPMSQQTMYVLSDLFPNLQELSIACSSVTSATDSGSPSARAAGVSSQTVGGSNEDLGTGAQDLDFSSDRKLKALRNLVGDQECRDIVDFWKDEWTID